MIRDLIEIGGGFLIGAGILAIGDDLIFLINYRPTLVGGAVATTLGLSLVTVAFLAGRMKR
jgi:hypothetical protein